MLVENLIHHFKLEKNYDPSNANELLDYIQKCYIQSELSIVQYKEIFFELDKQNAEKPYSYFIKTNPYEEVNLPG